MIDFLATSFNGEGEGDRRRRQRRKNYLILFILFLIGFFTMTEVIGRNLKYEEEEEDYSDEKFTSKPEDLIDIPGYIHVAIILTNMTANHYKIRDNFLNLARSIIFHARAQPVRFLFLTDSKKDIRLIKYILAYLLPPFPLVNRVIRGHYGTKEEVVLMDRFLFDFIDIRLILDQVRGNNKKMKQYFNNYKEGYVIIDKNTGQPIMKVSLLQKIIL